MKKIVAAAVAAWIGLLAVSANAGEIPFEENCIFYVSFDAEDFDADLAEGEAKGDWRQTPWGIPPAFTEGIRGKALLAKGGGILFPSKDNFSLARPGSVSLWIQPVEWTRGDDLPPDPDNTGVGWRIPTYHMFFWDGGMVGIQRMTNVLGDLDSMVAFAIGFPNLKRTMISTYGRYNWPDGGEWHHLALTWDKEEMILYIDGELVGKDMLIGRINPEDVLSSFCVGSSGDLTAVDEFAIYNRVLSADEIKAVFESCR